MIILTLGEALSVNIEILGRLKQLISSAPCPVLMVGSYWQWQYQIKQLGLKDFSMVVISKLESWNQGNQITFWDIDDGIFHMSPTAMSAEKRGLLAWKALEGAGLAKNALTRGHKLAFITSPIDKAACSLAGFKFSGQTEYFEQLCQKKGIMVLAGPKLKVGLATNHISLAQVSGAITSQLIVDKLICFTQTLHESYHIDCPRIAVTGLNPHCSDHGLFGNEEKDIIEPAISKARSKGIDAIGPIPADTGFFAAYQGHYDGILAMYHDQGLGPLKTVHFFDAINITGGLPFLRVSPDHGPAADLYGKNMANTLSFENTILHAYRYIQK